MFQSVKFEPSKAVRAIVGAVKVVGIVLAIVSAVIIVVPVCAGAMAKWAAGMIFDALRPKRTGEDGV